ncbi:MAG: acyltransferase family protein [Evtepia gabavorous]
MGNPPVTAAWTPSRSSPLCWWWPSTPPPLTTYSPDGDFLLTRSLARVAVPFFFMVTGQFVLGEVLQGRRPFSALWRQVKKILLLYLVAVVLYLPVGLYAGHYQGLSPLSAPSVCCSSTAPFTISGIFPPAPQGCFWCICWGGCCGAEGCWRSRDCSISSVCLGTAIMA